jgi:hypothetical protein
MLREHEVAAGREPLCDDAAGVDAASMAAHGTREIYAER